MRTRKKPSHIKQEDWDAVDSPPLTDEELAALRPLREVSAGFGGICREPQTWTAGAAEGTDQEAGHHSRRPGRARRPTARLAPAGSPA